MTEKYTATYKTFGWTRSSTVFDFHESIKVPKEILNRENNSIYFYLVDVIYSEATGGYLFREGFRGIRDGISLLYKYLSDDRIEIKADMS